MPQLRAISVPTDAIPAGATGAAAANTILDKTIAVMNASPAKISVKICGAAQEQDLVFGTVDSGKMKSVTRDADELVYVCLEKESPTGLSVFQGKKKHILVVS
ncbi:hypothetical protein APHAL10511_007904 [Amanita phalloides]|nr:hypothetical protein APHAL10511_007904 [Amanita phalloides]